jgi:hypothetical protein
MTLATAGEAKIHAENGGRISGTITSDLIGTVQNHATDDSLAYVQDASVQAAGLELRAQSSSSYLASAKEAVNSISGGTQAYVTDSTIAAGTGGVSLSARDTSLVSAESAELSIDIDVLITDTSIAAAMARNELNRSTQAYLDASTVTVTAGDVTVLAQDDATISATARAASVSDSAVIPGGVLLGLGGIVAANLIRGEVNARITGGSVQTVNSGDIRVEASDASAIDATTELSVQAKTPNVSFAPTGVTGGVSIAFNAIGWEFADFGLKTIDSLLTTELGDHPESLPVQTYVRDATIGAANDLVLSASSSAQLNATVSNAAESTSSALYGAAGVSSSAILASNLVSTAARAFVEYTGAVGTVQVGGSLTQTARDDADIHANSKVVSTSITTNDGGANVLNQAVADLAHDHTTTHGLTNLVFSDRVLLSDGYANGGTPGRVYRFMGTASDGLGRHLGSEDYADPGYWKEILETQLIPQGNNLTSSDAIAIGGLVVRNEVQSDVSAYTKNADVTLASGDLTLEAIENATIDATADSSAIASGGSAYGSGSVVAVNGTIATNVVLSKANAYAVDSDLTVRDADSGDADLLGNVRLDAQNTSHIEAVVQNTTRSGDTAVGLTLAFNTLGWASQGLMFNTVDALLGTDIGTEQPAEVRAYLRDTTVDADGEVSLSAVSEASITATVGNEATSAAAALYGATGMATSGVLASNKVSSLAQAYLDSPPAAVVVPGAVTISSADNAGAYANSKVVSSSITTNDGGAALLGRAVNDAVPADFRSDESTVSIRFGQQVRLTDDW